MNVFDFAMKIELQGKAFYETLAESTAMPGLSTIFLELSGDEQKHYETLLALKEGREFVMADSHALENARSIFTDLSGRRREAEALRDAADAYRMALRIEKESVQLYEAMAKREEKPETVQLFLKIANEEKKHYNIIENVCELITRPANNLTWREPHGKDS